jgi:hypothetical protein
MYRTVSARWTSCGLVFLELLLHRIDVLTACGEVVETVWGIKRNLAASQAKQVCRGLAFLAEWPGTYLLRTLRLYSSAYG